MPKTFLYVCLVDFCLPLVIDFRCPGDFWYLADFGVSTATNLHWCINTNLSDSAPMLFSFAFVDMRNLQGGQSSWWWYSAGWRLTTCPLYVGPFSISIWIQLIMVYCHLLYIYGSMIQIFWSHTKSSIVHIQYLAKYSRCRQPRHNGTILHTLQHKSCYSSDDHRNYHPGIPSQSQATATHWRSGTRKFLSGMPAHQWAAATRPQDRTQGNQPQHSPPSDKDPLGNVDSYQIILI